MIDLNLEEAHLWEVSPKEPLHGGLLSGLRSEIQDTEAPQWRRGRGGGNFMEFLWRVCQVAQIKLRTRKSMEIAIEVRIIWVVQDTKTQRFVMITLGF